MVSTARPPRSPDGETTVPSRRTASDAPRAKAWSAELHVRSDPHAAEQVAHRAGRAGSDVDRPGEKRVRRGRRRLDDRVEAGADEPFARSFAIQERCGNAEVIDHPCPEVLLQRRRHGAGERIVGDPQAVDQAPSVQRSGGDGARDPAVGGGATEAAPSRG